MSDITSSPNSSAHPLNGSASPANSVGRYSDPETDVIVLSSEGKQFRVHLYVLKANSPYFRDLLSTHSTSNEPITLSIPSKLLRKLLDAMYLRSFPCEFVWAHHTEIFQAVDQYSLKLAEERALLSILACVDRDPWMVFCLASRRGNRGLAQAALRALAVLHPSEVSLDRLTKEMALGEVTMPYLLGLFNAVLKSNSASAASGVGGREGELDWGFIAANFSPVAT